MSQTGAFTLAYAIRFRPVAKYLGQLCLLIGPGAAARRLAGLGGDPEDILGTSRGFARQVTAIYVLITALAAAAAMALSGRPFDALLQVLAAVSTAGFSSYDTSLAGLGGWDVRAVVLAACLAGALPFALYCQVWLGRWRSLLRDREVQTLVLAVLVFTLALYLALQNDGWSGDAETLAQAAAMALSAQTTTGFSTLEVAALGAEAKGLLILSMALGGGMGSTAGSIKLLRLLIAVRLLQHLILRTTLPRHAVAKVRLHGHRLDEEEIQRALLIMLLYALLIALAWLPFLGYGYDPLDALFEVVSAAGTVGLSAGITSPGLEPALKYLLCLVMLLGRLEIFAFCVLFAPLTWFGPRRKTP